MLTIDQLAPGMVLATAVYDRKDQLLLTERIELTAHHLTILRTWGIQEVEILGDAEEIEQAAVPIPEELSSEQLAKAKAELLPLFEHTDLKHPAMSELLHLAVIWKAKHG